MRITGRESGRNKPYQKEDPSTKKWEFGKGVIECRELPGNEHFKTELGWPKYDSVFPGYCVPPHHSLSAVPSYPDPTSETGAGWSFQFWTFDGFAYSDPQYLTELAVPIPPPGLDCIQRVTKWYAYGEPGPGPEPHYKVTLLSFNGEAGSSAGETPVTSATPPTALDQSGLYDVALTKDQAVTIVAKDHLGPVPFHHWWLLSDPSPQDHGVKTLHLEANTNTTTAIAYFGEDPEPLVEKPDILDHLELDKNYAEFFAPIDPTIYERIADLLRRSGWRSGRGRSFIRGAERPPVGRNMARGPRKGR